MRLGRVVGVAFAGALIASAACGGNDDGEGTSVDREVVVRTGDELRFEPDVITVGVGERVRLVADNRDGAQLHDFSVENIEVRDVMVEGAEHVHGEAAAFELHVAADAGERGVMEFVALQPGEYQFFCSVPGHADAGMTGTIVVEA